MTMLSTADQVVKKIEQGMDPHKAVVTTFMKEPKKKRKKVTRKRRTLRTIFATGEFVSKIKVSTIMKELKAITEQCWTGPEDDGWIITGASREIDIRIINACKSLKMKVLSGPANFAWLGGKSAEQMRNSLVLESFKPDAVLIFTNNPLEKDPVLEHLEKIAKRKSLVKIVGK